MGSYILLITLFWNGVAFQETRVPAGNAEMCDIMRTAVWVQGNNYAGHVRSTNECVRVPGT